MKNFEAEGVWLNKKTYEEAEDNFYQQKSTEALAPLAGEVAKARQKLIETRDTFSCEINAVPLDVGAFKFIEKKVVEFEKAINQILEQLKALDIRVSSIENIAGQHASVHEINLRQQPHVKQVEPAKKDNDDDDVDLFASSDEEESAEAVKIREERLAAYAAKKSKKPVLIAKSNIILDVKPWDDETDMKQMEREVRKIKCDGLLWGASKLVPLAFGIHKLQIASVVEDDKVSIDWLTEQIESIEDLVQSVDIAAFNKI